MHKNVLYKDFDKHYPTLTKGKGPYVFDNSGNKYLDAVSGVGVASIGHGVEKVIEALADQARKISFSYSGQMDNKPKHKLAEKLHAWSPDGFGETKSFFCSSGSQATEAAVKLAYQYQCERGKPNKRKVVSRWQSYHGNTIGALSLSGRTAWRKMYSTYLLDFPHIPPPYCYRCPYGDTYPDCEIRCAQELDKTIEQEGSENFAAFIAEPVIGTSMSSVVPLEEYYPMIREICDRHDVLFIVDEVMSGIGRTGYKFSIDHWGVIPDLIATAKGLSGGYTAMGALLLREKVWRAIAEGSGSTTHSHTFSGNPLSCTVGAAVLEYMEENDLVNQSRKIGEKLKKSLEESLKEVPEVGDIRGTGLMLGVELISDPETREPFPVELNLTKKVVREARKEGLLILGGAPGLIDGKSGDHFQILPPYVITEEHVRELTEKLDRALRSALTSLPETRTDPS